MSVESENREITQGLKNIQVVSLSHAYRINGVVDIWKRKTVVFDIINNEYHNIDDKTKRKSLIEKLILSYPKRDPFKKTDTGKMSIQEFKHQSWNDAQDINAVRAEDYHWKNNIDKTSEDHLYILVHGERIKIGRSKDVVKRMNTLKTAFSEYFECWTFNNKGFMESTMHNCFSELRINGEWFKYHWRIKIFIGKYHDGKDIITRSTLDKKRKNKKLT